MRGDAGLVAAEGLEDLQRPAIVGLGLGQPAVLGSEGGAVGEDAGQLAARLWPTRRRPRPARMASASS